MVSPCGFESHLSHQKRGRYRASSFLGVRKDWRRAASAAPPLSSTARKLPALSMTPITITPSPMKASWKLWRVKKFQPTNSSGKKMMTEHRHFGNLLMIPKNKPLPQHPVSIHMCWRNRNKYLHKRAHQMVRPFIIAVPSKYLSRSICFTQAETAKICHGVMRFRII